MKNIYDYTIMVTHVENDWWQAQLKELPEVITCVRTWGEIYSAIIDALELCQKIEKPKEKRDV